MNAPDQAVAPALDQKGLDAGIGGATGARQCIVVGRGKEVGPRVERLDVLLDVIGNCLDPRSGLDRIRHGVRSCDGAAEHIGETGVDLPAPAR